MGGGGRRWSAGTRHEECRFFSFEVRRRRRDAPTRYAALVPHRAMAGVRGVLSLLGRGIRGAVGAVRERGARLASASPSATCSSATATADAMLFARAARAGAMSRPFTARLAAHSVQALGSWPRAMSAASGDRDDDEEVEEDDAPLSPADEKQRPRKSAVDPNPKGIRSAAPPSMGNFGSDAVDLSDLSDASSTAGPLPTSSSTQLQSFAPETTEATRTLSLHQPRRCLRVL